MTLFYIIYGIMQYLRHCLRQKYFAARRFFRRNETITKVLLGTADIITFYLIILGMAVVNSHTAQLPYLLYALPVFAWMGILYHWNELVFN